MPLPNNNAKRTRLANEYGKLNREVDEIIKKEIPTRNKIQALEDKRIDLHDWVWVRFSGEVEDDDDLQKPLKSETLKDGTRVEEWTYRRDRFDEDGSLISRYILTTVGRVVMNHTIIDAVAATS